MSKRVVAVGDIHGCDVALESLLATLELTQNDTLVVLGDVVDRGPGTKRCVELLMAIKSLCNFVFIMGNHEEMMLDGLDGGSMERVWLNNGGLEALQSYGGHYEDIPEADLDFLRSSLDYWETETEIFIHANLQPGIPLEDQDVEWLRWSRLTGWEPPHPSGKRVLCGHTPQTDGRIRVLDGWIGLDTWAYHDQFLTGLDVTNDIVFQTSQSGKVLPAVQLESFA